MNKKFLSLVLALVMVLGAFANVFAAAPEAPKAEENKVPAKTTNDAKIQWLIDQNIVEGRKVNEDPKDNDLALDQDIKRSEITKLLIYALGEEDLAAKLQGAVKIYPDVDTDYWANGVIMVGSTVKSPANKLPFLVGYDDGTFKPEKDVTYAEVAKMLTVIVKEDLTEAMHDKANKVNWPSQWLLWANELGILDGVKVGDSSKAAPRHDAFVMLYNALYEMEDLRKIPAEETRGIISDVKATSLTLNQGDYAKKFKVTEDTVFVKNGFGEEVVQPIQWYKVIQNEEYYIGSFVRVLADDEGNVTHIVQLGNPYDGARNNDYKAGWNTVADKVASSFDRSVVNFTKVDTDKKELSFDDVLTGENVVLSLTNRTNYYVADPRNDDLTKVKDLDAALKLAHKIKGLDMYPSVYAGYNVLSNSNINEATEVVFNVTDADTSTEIVRVVNVENRVLNYQLPGVTATDNIVADLAGISKVFPNNYDLTGYDVIALGKDVEGVVAERPIISYHKDGEGDPVFKIAEVKYKNANKVYNEVEVPKNPQGDLEYIKLVDKHNFSKKIDVLADAKLFFGDEIVPGAKVQVRFANTAETAVDIVSVVPTETKLAGMLKDGLDSRQEEGTIVTAISGITAEADKNYTITINVDGKDEQYVVSGIVLKEMQDASIVKGSEVTFLQTNSKYEDYNAPKAWNFTLKSTPLIPIEPATPATPEGGDAEALEVTPGE